MGAPSLSGSHQTRPDGMSSSNDAAVESSTAAEMEDTIARISSHKGVEGVLIMDRRGMVIYGFSNLWISSSSFDKLYVNATMQNYTTN